MNNSLITVRYVKALYQLADEAKLQDTIKTDIGILLSCLQESSEFSTLIESPLIKISKKIRLIDTIFDKDLNKLTLQFLHLLIRNKREIHLKNICHYYLRFYKSSQGLKEALITTAKPLSMTNKEEIFNFITRKLKVNIEMHEKVDAEIIGGFILQIEDQQINASIQHQLNKIKRELIHT